MRTNFSRHLESLGYALPVNKPQCRGNESGKTKRGAKKLSHKIFIILKTCNLVFHEMSKNMRCFWKKIKSLGKVSELNYKNLITAFNRYFNLDGFLIGYLQPTPPKQLIILNLRAEFSFSRLFKLKDRAFSVCLAK
ncbi:hypothetical protein BpHYR1_009961 [Brachionus plicatilis]|uniref:Uncharacterized protein n=1 Tax=Brachionus plicatilis TaxID=10195 RepID=A0A3M7QJK8_BRAPC|nr:hypothetical protein BpHYR1_009961 [Brachionus plicatilis]